MIKTSQMESGASRSYRSHVWMEDGFSLCYTDTHNGDTIKLDAEAFRPTPWSFMTDRIKYKAYLFFESEQKCDNSDDCEIRYVLRWIHMDIGKKIVNVR